MNVNSSRLSRPNAALWDSTDYPDGPGFNLPGNGAINRDKTDACAPSISNLLFTIVRHDGRLSGQDVNARSPVAGGGLGGDDLARIQGNRGDRRDRRHSARRRLQ